ncbi:hypothetical protein [Stenotrophomonas tumulicola]|uniref:Uncharacterized protein n=1 Tax=Stenotrophomonas tumulicola TaxID=1685415 RepID=A0A7W3FL38_9GAMM|nr:hypothetical protein [Stenotrophomonas tumulicola]MBA8681534.1 hypothetical protein [Stenotrophomonas tumulicola]
MALANTTLAHAAMPPAPPSAPVTRYPEDLAHARRLLTHHPSASQLFLAGLARDHGADARPDALIADLASHRALVERVDTQLSTQASAGYRALHEQLLARPPWTRTVDIFEQAVSARATRDIARDTCRRDARKVQGPDEDEAWRGASTGSRQASAADAGKAVPGARLRTRGALQAASAGLLLATQAQSTRASAADQQQALMTGATGGALAGGQRLLSPPRVVAASGAALLTTATILWAAMAPWGEPLPPATPGTSPPPPASPDPDAVLQALQYLQQHQGPDGDNLLESLLWREAGGNATPASALDVLSPEAIADLQRFAGKDTPLGPWLATMLELDRAETTAAPTPHGDKPRKIRNVPDLPSPITPRSAPRGVQIAACAAIRPSTQTLTSVEAATQSLTSTRTLAAVPSADLCAFADCLLTLHGNLRGMHSKLIRQRDAMLRLSTLLPAIHTLRIVGLDRLATRTQALTDHIRAALIQVNARIMDRIG